MKVALEQLHIVWEDKEENLSRAEELIRKCSLDLVDLVLFPEMSFTGFSMNVDITSEDNEYTLSRMAECAKHNHISIGFGWVKKGPVKCENHYSIVGVDGGVVCDYIKIHPFSFSGEDKFFVGGNYISLFEVDGFPFSCFICYDLRFPEVFRAVSKKAHAVIVPACWPAKRAEHWLTLLRARAIENQYYILAINCVGVIGGIYYSGDSCVITPNGDVVKNLSGVEGSIVIDIIDDASSFRTSFPVLNDIRKDIHMF